MPTYDYHCQQNNATVEVRHGMTESLKTWGELCARAEIDPGDTPPETPVERAISSGGILFTKSRGSAPQSAPMPRGGGSCGSGCGCH